jgi:HAE1 family hydrophobic/amphiphilic exporter-1
MIDKGVEVRKAMGMAASLRLRPIIMTTATAVLGLLPLALGTGEAAELRAPMAWTVIGGLISSTLTSLTVVPCLYLVLERMRPRRRAPAAAQA